MALLPYTILEAAGQTSPLIVDVPHSGRIYPVDFAYSCPLALLRQYEDAYVDELVSEAVQFGADVLIAEFPRSMIDVNRAADDIDPAAIDGEWGSSLKPEAAALAGYGLVRRICGNGVAIYRGRLTVAEIRRRLSTYYTPYHAKLDQMIVAAQEKFGACLLLDMHSMPSRSDPEIAQYDFILGDRDGSSCNPLLTEQAHKTLEAMGYRVATNKIYKGREIVRRYGRQGRGADALQIEINRRLYLDENDIRLNAGTDPLRQNLNIFFAAMAKIHTA